MAAAKAFLRSAKSVTQVEPEQVTTDGHTSYPKAIAEELGTDVDHRTSQYKNNVIEQDHRGIKGRYRSMRGFKNFDAAHRFCRAFDEIRNFLRPTSYINQITVAVDCLLKVAPRAGDLEVRFIDVPAPAGLAGPPLAQALGEQRRQLGLPVAHRLVGEHEAADQEHLRQIA